MKNIYLVTLLFLVCSKTQAQNNTFPTDQTIWINQHRSYYLDENSFPVYTSENITKYCLNGIDTMINSIHYTEINTCDALTSNYHGAIRENAGQVFFVPSDSTSEFLLYDFNLNTGATADVLFQFGNTPHHSYSIHTVQIGNVDTILVNNQPRRRINVGGYNWIEGIGSTSGLFTEAYGNISNYFVDLICMSSDDTTLYSYGSGHLEHGTPGVCDLYLTVPDCDIANHDVTIFPNPTTGRLFIEEANQMYITRIRIMNSLGQVISSYFPNKSRYANIQIEGKPGLYLIEVYSKNGKKTTHKVLKH